MKRLLKHTLLSSAVGLALGLTPCDSSATEPRQQAEARACHEHEDCRPPRDLTQARGLLIAGASIAGVGLLSAATGFGVLGGIHAANPGPGLSFEAEDEASRRRLVRLAKGMEGLAWSGVALSAVGAVVLTVGAVQIQRTRGPAADETRTSRVGVGVGVRSVTLSVRF